jgi:Tol biopolymer transport system component
MRSISIAIFCASLFGVSTARATSEGAGVIAKDPSSSPSGAEVVFEADFTGSPHLWIATTDGRSIRQLTTTPGLDEEPAWSPGGQRIAFASTRASTNVTDIWSIRTDGSGLIQLTSNGLNNRQPSWSPDGSRIAFISDRGGTNDVWLMNADGSSLRRVTSLPGHEDHPSFSPGGDQIVFSETSGSSAALMVVAADGSGLQQITAGGFRDWNPSWSAQGILFSSDRDGSGHWTIWQIQPTGSGLTQVGNNMGLDPVRLPNGKIAFTDETGGFRVLSAVVVLDPVTGTKSRVTTIDGFLLPIDIRPGGTPNPVNPRSQGVIPVALLSTATLDAATAVDQASITFGASGDEASRARCTTEDVNGDGLPDLLCHFNTPATGFRSGDTVGILRARTVDGVALEGRDSVVIVPH